MSEGGAQSVSVLKRLLCSPNQELGITGVLLEGSPHLFCFEQKVLFGGNTEAQNHFNNASFGCLWRLEDIIIYLKVDK